MDNYEWNMLKYRLPKAIYRQSSLLYTQNQTLFVFGGCASGDHDSGSHGASNIVWNFKFVGNYLKWDIQRLIWIGFYKRSRDKDNENVSLLSKLPKDIIFFILNFLSSGNIFAIAEKKSMHNNPYKIPVR